MGSGSAAAIRSSVPLNSRKKRLPTGSVESASAARAAKASVPPSGVPASRSREASDSASGVLRLTRRPGARPNATDIPSWRPWLSSASTTASLPRRAIRRASKTASRSARELCMANQGRPVVWPTNVNRRYEIPGLFQAERGTGSSLAQWPSVVMKSRQIGDGANRLQCVL